MIKDIKSKFPNIRDEILTDYYYTYTKLKHKALKEYGINFNINIGDDLETSEYGFSSISYNDEEKKAIGNFNLKVMEEQIKHLELKNDYLESSIFGTLVSALFHNYIKAILHFHYKDEISKYGVENAASDFIHLYFCEDILNFPQDQIFNKLNVLLQEMNFFGSFESKEELSDYCLKILNPIAFKISKSHSEFISANFKNDNNSEQIINEPSQAPNSDIYDSSSFIRN